MLISSSTEADAWQLHRGTTNGSLDMQRATLALTERGLVGAGGLAGYHCSESSWLFTILRHPNTQTVSSTPSCHGTSMAVHWRALSSIYNPRMCRRDRKRVFVTLHSAALLNPAAVQMVCTLYN
jgi:hypothetical protein